MTLKKEQVDLIDFKPLSFIEWAGMPEYDNEKKKDPEIVAKFKFRNIEDFEEFKRLVKKHVYNDEKVFDGMQSKTNKQSWFPLKEKASKYRYVSDAVIKPQFPIYIVSKGRWERRPTCNALDEMGVPYLVLVEPEEYEQYCSAIGADKVIVIPEKYKKEYDTFWKDDDLRTGPGHARNFAWDHSLENGFDFH